MFMEFLIEGILDLILEGSVEASKSKKVPKTIRYILIVSISLVFISIVGLIIWLGINILKDNTIGGVFIILFGIFFLILGVLKFRKVYLNKTK